ncbi:baeRF2 domain-containing protein, partial [Nocardia sp. NPDC003482]
MVTTSLRELADHEGPFVSVYVDNSGNIPALRAELAEKGAPPPLLDLVDDTLTSTEPGRTGHAVIAGGGEVLVAEPLPVPPPRPVVRVSPLPYLLPLLQFREPRTPYIVALADRAGAQIRGVDSRGREVAGTVPGAAPNEVAWLADRAGATLVLVAGEASVRAALSDALGPRGRRVVELEHDSRAIEFDSPALQEQIRRVLHEEAELRRRAVVRLFAQERSRPRGLAVEGLAATTAALREANADTLLIDPDRLGDSTVGVGPDPTQVVPVDRPPHRTWPRRADEALPVAA